MIREESTTFLSLLRYIRYPKKDWFIRRPFTYTRQFFLAEHLTITFPQLAVRHDFVDNSSAVERAETKYSSDFSNKLFWFETLVRNNILIPNLPSVAIDVYWLVSSDHRFCAALFATWIEWKERLFVQKLFVVDCIIQRWLVSRPDFCLVSWP